MVRETSASLTSCSATEELLRRRMPMQDRVAVTEAEMIPIAQVMERLGVPASAHLQMGAVVDHLVVKVSPPSRV
jgi:hypothetical protein|tara:strand:- start:27207 stop:27428 length:222 start_codon:yes stop_codon:yes gene_type:complete